jgi:hypothetical protein
VIVLSVIPGPVLIEPPPDDDPPPELPPESDPLLPQPAAANNAAAATPVANTRNVRFIRCASPRFGAEGYDGFLTAVKQDVNAERSVAQLCASH